MALREISEKISGNSCNFSQIRQAPLPGYSKQLAMKPCSICAVGDFRCILHINGDIENGRRSRCEICEETGDDCDAEYQEDPVSRIARLRFKRKVRTAEIKSNVREAMSEGCEEREKVGSLSENDIVEVEKRKAWWKVKQMILEALENSYMDGEL